MKEIDFRIIDILAEYGKAREHAVIRRVPLEGLETLNSNLNELRESENINND